MDSEPAKRTLQAHGQLYMVTGRCYGDVQSIYNTKHFKRSTPMVVLVRWVTPAPGTHRGPFPARAPRYPRFVSRGCLFVLV